MSNFDDLLSMYVAPTEVDIKIPGRVGADKGGSSASAAKPADTHSSTTGPEPAPQLPEGSDPDSPTEPEELDEDIEEVPEPAAVEDPGPDEDVTVAPEAETADQDAETDPDVRLEQPAAPVVPRKGGGLSFEGESAYLKQFPRILIDQMRDILGVQVGAAFARDISQVSIVTAFVMASMGTEIATDEITAHAAQAFRQADPRTDAIDRRTEALLEQQTKTQSMLKKVLAQLDRVVETADVLEMGQAYALAERTAQLDTSGTTPETIDVTQKRAIASRDNIRRRVAAQRRDEKARAGRPIR